MKVNEALRAATERLRAAGIEDAAIEAEVLLRHALALRPDVGAQHPAPSGFPHPEPVEGPSASDPLSEPSSDPPSPLTERGLEPVLSLSKEGEVVSRAHLYIHLNDHLGPDTAAIFDSLLARRLSHEPTVYITGHREFYGLDFLVTPAVLIPRPETETLVEAAIKLVNSLRKGHPEPGSPEQRRRVEAPSRSDPPSPLTERGLGGEVLDLGTGSGAIAISLARALPDATIIATDASDAALDLARRNAARHGVLDRIAFRHGDLLSPLNVAVDLIVANLPYVKTHDWSALPPEIRDHEPRLALDGGPDGLDVIRRLLAEARRYLHPHGAIALEFGDGQSETLLNLAREAFPTAAIDILPDLAGRPRVLTIRLP